MVGKTHYKSSPRFLSRGTVDFTFRFLFLHSQAPQRLRLETGNEMFGAVVSTSERASSYLSKWRHMGVRWELLIRSWKAVFLWKKKHFKFIWNPLFRRGFACRATSLNFSVSWGNITFWTRNSRKIWNHLPSLLPHQKSHHKVQRTFPQHHLLKGIDRN